MTRFSQFDIVKVPFPFTELPFTKRRPALILSHEENFTFKEGVGKYVMAMITSSMHKAWPLDYHLTDLKNTGLSSSSLVRMKIFTVDETLVLAKIGAMSKKDQTVMRETLGKLFLL